MPKAGSLRPAFQQLPYSVFSPLTTSLATCPAMSPAACRTSVTVLRATPVHVPLGYPWPLHPLVPAFRFR